MSEEVRSTQVHIEVDTNKQTHVYEIDKVDIAEIAAWYLGVLPS